MMGLSYFNTMRREMVIVCRINWKVTLENRNDMIYGVFLTAMPNQQTAFTVCDPLHLKARQSILIIIVTVHEWISMEIGLYIQYFFFVRLFVRCSYSSNLFPMTWKCWMLKWFFSHQTKHTICFSPLKYRNRDHFSFSRCVMAGFYPFVSLVARSICKNAQFACHFYCDDENFPSSCGRWGAL